MSRNRMRALVIGGAASGKSAFAERLVSSRSGRRVYIATATASDDEMQEKIRRHVSRRGSGWRTVEESLDVAGALQSLEPDEACLLDCVTLWLANLSYDDAHDDSQGASAATGDSDPRTALVEERDRLIAAIKGCPADLVVVSNELGMGIVPENAMARRFREEHGRLNVRLAETCDTVVQVVAGLPNVLKGNLP